MTLSERHKTILELLRENGSVDVGGLSSSLKVSAVTIRKDLDLMEEKKLLYRTHGGAILADPYIATRKVSEKEKLNPEAKHRIGLKAVEMISPQETLIIASGTTVQAFARCIQNMKMTIITSAMNVAMELLTSLTSRSYSWAESSGIRPPSAISEYAIRMLDNFNCSKLFLGVDGIDPEYGPEHYPSSGSLSQQGHDQGSDKGCGPCRLLQIQTQGIQQNMRCKRHRPDHH